MFFLLLLVLWINKNLSSKLLLQCFHSGQIYLTKENIDLPPLDFIKTYLGVKFPICCLLNKNLCSAEVSGVLWSHTWLRASTRGSPVTAGTRAGVTEPAEGRGWLGPARRDQQHFGLCFSDCVMG